MRCTWRSLPTLALLLPALLLLPGAALGTPNNECNADGGHAHISIGDAVIDNMALTATFTITCNPCGAVNATSYWKTFDGTATAPADYTAVNGQQIIIGPNSSEPQFYDIVVNLTGPLGAKNFTVGLGGAPGEQPNISVGPPCLITDDTTADANPNPPPNSPPTANAGPDQTVECDGGTSVSLNGNGSSDPDGDSLTYSWTGPFPEGGGTVTGATPSVTLPVGVHVISLTVNDGLENSAADTVQITVEDTEDPTVTLNGPANQTLECAIDNYSEQSATADDACDGSLPVSTSGSVNDGVVGVYEVDYTATDSAGNSDTATRTVTVEDTTGPTITLNGDAVVTLECGIDSYIEPGATASDACDPTVSVIISGSVDTSTPGTYEITYTATDDSGNTTEETRTVNVVDTTPPVITLNGDAVMTLECGFDDYIEPGATATDDCDPMVDLVITGSVDTETPGTYEITYTATDDSGNVAVETRTVHVVDTTPPDLELEAGPTTLWPPNHKYDTTSLDDIVISASDVCDETVSEADVTITSVSSDEPEDVGGGGDGNTVDDIVIAGDCRSVDLRSERQGGGNGRVYTVNVAVSDASGNTTAGSYQVHVPHSKKSGAVDDGPAYSVAGCAAASSATVIFKGKVVDIEGGAGIPGIDLLGPGEVRARTDERGRYRLQLPAGADAYELTLEGDGYVTRNTYVSAEGEVNRATFSLIAENSVDLELFDRAARGSSGDEARTSRRWVEEPVFVILTRELSEPDGPAGDRLSKKLRQSIEEWVRADVPLYTGGALAGDRIRSSKLARGEQPGKLGDGLIRVSVNAGSCADGAQAESKIRWREPGIVERGEIQLHAACGGLDRGVFRRQLAYQLGLSIAGEADGPTRADVLHGTILYQRFPGNRGPDRDPHPAELDSPSRRDNLRTDRAVESEEEGGGQPGRGFERPE